ncbi:MULTISPECIES: hypothetical protein [unclassified Agarivorans]|uniref:hypothetical protein n=1 Tax=unclassified Agarivorans TaxID=2636026 RepID=UPI0026E136DA|nr:MULTISPECIES: hypothetical protein [unclassified Agarivorans]MDO6688023.1 hypothetical protein [Agarivorans sp. 3_MG-2023]MDO6715290.1 hypothetical protein [Agarivorans sp. 2_MG-2023]MDO6763413.1 hypothetical protein [Agarivorans sp. 1_MG-2023]
MMKWMVIGISLLFAASASAQEVRIWLQSGSESQWMELSDLQIQNTDGSLKNRIVALDSKGKRLFMPLSELAFIQADNQYYYVSNQYIAVTHSGAKFSLPSQDDDAGMFVAKNGFGGYTTFDYSALRRIIFSK